MTLAIVGIDHINDDKARTNRRSELMLLPPGADMELRLEPRNRADPNAIAVHSPSGLQVGYLSAERAPWIGAKIRNGEILTAIFQGLDGRAGYLRVAIGGGKPTLPANAAAPAIEKLDDESGFWPDPDGPEWGA
ncbi:HIRAN domain-containing protein [Sphingomonas phyllosphaerae]|uniref:HIRAN domain-containing protein n=1 Tax=Sphingomonas phyllosphaerae TaxID=257003 RepID=UPI001EE193DF|nr:HIRAN domain-containing protein [Sphingomonas phyllosphaerae]